MENETKEKYRDEIAQEIDKMNDELYIKTREKITKGGRLPYREYLRRRSLHWLENVATNEEIEDAHVAIKNRTPGIGVK